MLRAPDLAELEGLEVMAQVSGAARSGKFVVPAACTSNLPQFAGYLSFS
jgi:hypothetical protein